MSQVIGLPIAIVHYFTGRPPPQALSVSLWPPHLGKNRGYKHLECGKSESGVFFFVGDLLDGFFSICNTQKNKKKGVSEVDSTSPAEIKNKKVT